MDHELRPRCGGPRELSRVEGAWRKRSRVVWPRSQEVLRAGAPRRQGGEWCQAWEWRWAFFCGRGEDSGVPGAGCVPLRRS